MLNNIKKMNYHSDINRGTGRTTRIVDHAVQLLITTGKIFVPVYEKDINKLVGTAGVNVINGACVVCDHENVIASNKYLMHRIVSRIEHEHETLDIHVKGSFITILGYKTYKSEKEISYE